jgi:hypothetical protein
VAASSSAGTISDRWRPTNRGAVDAGGLQVCALQQQAAQVQVEQPDGRPGQVLHHEPMAALGVAQASSATRRALSCPALLRNLKTEKHPIVIGGRAAFCRMRRASYRAARGAGRRRRRDR